LLIETRVRRIVADHAGRRVHHVVATGPDGMISVTGGTFVLCAGAVNSAALLLASADYRNPSGLANFL
jgi:choline dehydrogenase-like flavoprotein